MSAASRSPLPALALGALALLLGGCATVSEDGGFGALTQIGRERVGHDPRLIRNEDDERTLDALNATIVRLPLSADDAVRLALLNNRDLQATYWRVGIAQAELVQAGRLENPSFRFQRTRPGAEIDIERAITFNLVNLLTAPLATRIEGRRFEQTKLLVANEIVQHAGATRRAYFDAVAAAQGVAYARQVNNSAEAGAQLAGRMEQAGNLSLLDQTLQQLYYAQASAALVRASQQAVAAREKLTRLMGLWGENAGYSLPDRLPDLPATPAELANVEQLAMRARLDIQAARLEAEQTAASLGLTRGTRFVNVLDLAYLNKSTAGQSSAPGYEITLELPLFDWGSARVAKAQAIYMQSLSKVAQVATTARSEARESYLGYRSAYDLAKHYRDQIIPLRKTIADQTLLRYNAMLIGVFELLADAREQAEAVNSSIDALKEYWIAQANLETALGGRLPAPARTDESRKESSK